MTSKFPVHIMLIEYRIDNIGNVTPSEFTMKDFVADADNIILCRKNLPGLESGGSYNIGTKTWRKIKMSKCGMKKILACGPFDGEKQKVLQDIATGNEIIFMDKEAVTTDIIQNVDAVIGNISIDILKCNQSLEWVQLTTSGADAYAKPGVVGENTILTCATGGYGIGIAEYMVAMLLVMMKKIPTYLENHKKAVWCDEGMVASPMGKRVLIVGTGDIGLEFARRMKAFGCNIAGIRRRTDVCPAEIDEIHGMTELETEVGKADIIALCLPGTEQTYHLFDETLLGKCKRGTYLMNVGRGSAIDTEAILKKEIYSRFAGVWLDVCEQEPLPDGHPLYLVPNMLITPHITGGFHLDVTIDNVFHICVHNLKAWLHGTEYVHVVDRRTGYSM